MFLILWYLPFNGTIYLRTLHFTELEQKRSINKSPITQHHYRYKQHSHSNNKHKRRPIKRNIILSNNPGSQRAGHSSKLIIGTHLLIKTTLKSTGEIEQQILVKCAQIATRAINVSENEEEPYSRKEQHCDGAFLIAYVKIATSHFVSWNLTHSCNTCAS